MIFDFDRSDRNHTSQPDENVDEDDPDYIYVNLNNKLLEDLSEAKLRRSGLGLEEKRP